MPTVSDSAPDSGWIRFRAAVRADETRLARLLATPDADAFHVSALALAAELGIPLAPEQITRAIIAARQARMLHHPSLASSPPPTTERDAPHSPHWLPIQLHPGDASAPPTLEWSCFGEPRLIDPFFEQSISAALRHPARLLFTRHTGLAVLEDFAAGSPDLAPAGFVFHMSRCGSTLFAQALAADPRHVVLSEPPPIDELLARDAGDRDLTFAQRVTRLRGLVHAYARRRRPEETRLFIKFDAWHTVHLPVIRAAFPSTPWVFLHREPIEVLVSQRRMRGAKFLPGALDATLYGVDAPEFTAAGFETHTARLLGAACDAALVALTTPGSPGIAVDYGELNRRLPELIHEHFGVPEDETSRDAIAAALGRDAKNPVQPFRDDIADKHREADATLRALAETHLGPQRRRLLALGQTRAG